MIKLLPLLHFETETPSRTRIVWSISRYETLTIELPQHYDIVKKDYYNDYGFR